MANSNTNNDYMPVGGESNASVSEEQASKPSRKEN